MRNVWRILIVACLVSPAAVFLYYFWSPIYFLLSPSARTFVEHGPVAGNSVIGMHGGDDYTLVFSPDGKKLAYLWRDAIYYYPPELGARPLTMTDALQVRWISVDRPEQEHSTPLDSIDLRPQGKVYYSLTGRVSFAPDSRTLAAIYPSRIILIDLASGSNSSLQYDGELFGSMAWFADQEIVYSTENIDGTGLTFWRQMISDTNRVRIWSQAQQSWPTTAASQPSQTYAAPSLGPQLRFDHFSPDGRFVLLRRLDQRYALLDNSTGQMTPIADSVSDVYWKPDSSAVLIRGYDGRDWNALVSKIVLVSPDTAQSLDLTREFETAFPAIQGHSSPGGTFVGWTSDCEYFVLYSSHRGGNTGYLVKPHPFTVVMSQGKILRRSPIPGWLFLQGASSMEWIDYSGKRRMPIDGWPNYWTWSSDGRYAAAVRDSKISIFSPQLPR